MPLPATLSCPKPKCATSFELPKEMWGYDMDFLFAYPTLKIVYIQDARLGLLKLLFTFLILTYVVVYQIVYSGGYLATEKVSGGVRFKLEPPTVDSCALSNYGLPILASCKNDFPPIPSLSYCKQSKNDYHSGKKETCQYYDDAGLGNVFESSILVTTRITQRKETLVCSLPDSDSTSDLGLNTCPQIYNLTEGEKDETFYAANTEDFTVLFDASVIVSEFDIKGESADEDGLLFVAHNDGLCLANPTSKDSYFNGRLTNKAPCYIQPNRTEGNLDFFNLEVLMQAAGHSLDDKSSETGNPFRFDGATLMLEVEYTNVRSWSRLSKNITYLYTPYLLTKTAYSVNEAVWTGGVENYRSTRTLLQKHGIRINIIQSGNLAVFSFKELLVCLTTAMTLLAVATTIVDVIALYLLPDRKLYQDAKIQYTKDFSDLREEERLAKEMKRGSKRVRSGSKGGRTSSSADRPPSVVGAIQNTSRLSEQEKRETQSNPLAQELSEF